MCRQYVNDQQNSFELHNYEFILNRSYKNKKYVLWNMVSAP